MKTEIKKEEGRREEKGFEREKNNSRRGGELIPRFSRTSGTSRISRISRISRTSRISRISRVSIVRPLGSTPEAQEIMLIEVERPS